MPDSTIPPVATPAEAPRTRGYFNKAQIEHLALADSISTAIMSPARPRMATSAGRRSRS